MSAWIVSRQHIHVLVKALGERELVAGLSPTEIGRELWTENVRSIHYRYPDTAESDRDYPGPIRFRKSWAADYDYRPPRRKMSIHGLLKQADCYEYQTCEHPEYATSRARAWITALRTALKHAGANENGEAYNDAPWGV